MIIPSEGVFIPSDGVVILIPSDGVVMIIPSDGVVMIIPSDGVSSVTCLGVYDLSTR